MDNPHQSEIDAVEQYEWMDDDDNTDITLRDVWWIPAGLASFAIICGLAVWAL